MKFNEGCENIKFDWRQKYEKKCDACGNVYSIYSQEDDNPEYYTDIYLKCTNCPDEYVYFELPVN